MAEKYLRTEPPEARFFKHEIGAYELIALSDGGINYPGPLFLGNVPPEGVAEYGLPDKQIFNDYTILLIKAGDKLVLNDVGAGDMGNPPEIDKLFPGLDHTMSRTNLVVPSLKAAGIDPAEIDIVLITHAHLDHIAGLHDVQGNLVFPNAQYYVPQKEYDYWRSADPSAVEAEALREILKHLIEAARAAFDAIEGRITLVQGDEEVVPGVRFEAAHGHTPGQVMVSISAGEQKAYNISDLVVHPLFVENPEWAPAIDLDAGRADETRRRFYARAAEEKALVFGHHLGPFPNFGHIVEQDGGWLWHIDPEPPPFS